MIISVAVPVPLYRVFDYEPQAPDLLDEAQELPAPGKRVLVPFAGRQLVGIILQVNDASPSRNQKNSLKPITKVLDSSPTLSSELLELIHWASIYYCHPIGECFQTALPSILRKHEPVDLEFSMIKWKRTEKDFPSKSRATKQIALLELLNHHNNELWDDQAKQNGFTKNTLTSLEKNGYICAHHYDPLEAKHAQKNISLRNTELNKEQQLAVDTITDQELAFAITLVEGVTGSGKTEVYIACAKAALEKNKQVLILIPEINLSSQTLTRFQESLDIPIGLIHSGLSQKQRANTWHLAKEGAVKIIIGTRSAIFTPFTDLGLIVVDEEHDTSYKQNDHFKYSARDLAVKRAQIENCAVILGSATPSLESLKNAQENRYQHIKIQNRAGSGALPDIFILDVRSRPLENGIARPALNKIKEELHAGNQVILFQNRRGFSPTLICQSCGWLMHCPHCDAKMTVHSSPAKMHCHHCDHKLDIPKECPECKHSSLNALGAGTERLEYGLQQHFPDTNIWRFDRDLIRNDSDLNKQLNAVNKGEPGILVGTQMLAKGHDFHNVTLVCVIDADSSFFSADYRAIERSAQQIIQVSGRSGRGDKTGSVIIQTKQPEHPIFESIKNSDYSSIAHHELQDRQFCELPPYTKMISIRAEARDLASSLNALEELKRQCFSDETQQSHMLISGPIEASMTKKAGIYRAYLHLFFSNIENRTNAIGQLNKALDGTPTNKVRIFVDADPIDYI